MGLHPDKLRQVAPVSGLLCLKLQLPNDRQVIINPLPRGLRIWTLECNILLLKYLSENSPEFLKSKPLDGVFG
jgi:hypothetical protein